jgi:hypothetical protein
MEACALQAVERRIQVRGVAVLGVHLGDDGVYAAQRCIAEQRGLRSLYVQNERVELYMGYEVFKGDRGYYLGSRGRSSRRRVPLVCCPETIVETEMYRLSVYRYRYG